MTLWTFDTDMEGWDSCTLRPMIWYGSDGSPDPGCLRSQSALAGSTCTQAQVDVAESVTLNDTVFFRFRAVGTIDSAPDTLTVTMTLRDDALNDYEAAELVLDISATGAYDTGWQTINGIIPYTGNLSRIILFADFDDLLNDELDVEFDYVFVDTGEGPPITPGLTLSAGGIPGSILI